MQNREIAPSRQKKNKFFLFCARLFVTLPTIMKTRKLIVAIAAAAICAACGSKSGDNSLKFKTVKVEKTVSIVKEEGAPKCSVNLQFEAAVGEPAERAKAINGAIADRLLNAECADLQQAADSFAGKYTSDYLENIAPLYREDRGDETKRPWYEHHYYITSETSEGREGITVYTATVDYYESGVHGINQRFVMNFDNQTGKLLTLDDIFVTGYMQPLNDLLLKALMEKTEAKDLNSLHDMGYLYSMDIFAPENFKLDKDHVTFIYNAYEIAPYSMGIIELVIDNDELEALWK